MPKKKSNRGRKAHQYDPKIARQIELSRALGFTEEQTFELVDLDRKTVKKYYPEELKTGKIKIDNAVGGALVKQALKGNMTAIIFYLKTRCGWKEGANFNATIKLDTPNFVSFIDDEEEFDG